MTLFIPHIPTCHLCNKPVPLQAAKTDATGRTVHEGCYLLSVGSGRATTPRETAKKD
jgi:hypothetical protein